MIRPPESATAAGAGCPKAKAPLGHPADPPNASSILRNNQSVSIEQALAYIDREQQRHYDKYIKPYLKKGYKWQPDNIDYLYTRSFYGKASTEAYRFYYSNALKNYKTYDNLYTQAQLALIFQRHGDSKAARDLIRRLKEKALVSDEMGMYWRDNRSGWCWYERPIETQALLIQAFREVTPKDTPLSPSCSSGSSSRSRPPTGATTAPPSRPSAP